ncbi:MAG: SufD family Fe-S cluster assembly protein [Sphingomonadaceae bacterium]
MSSAALPLPTPKDEEWRYADLPALKALAPSALDDWKEIRLIAGETRRKTLILGGEFPELHRIRIVVAQDARAEMFVVNAGPASCRVEVEISLDRGAHFEFGGVTIGGGDATREFVTRLAHVEPDATSNQIVRAVHWGQAIGNFLGTVHVARDAQKTDAAQNFRAILLEKGASANARPELEIYADDVKCAHGAAIGQMDENAAFYMAARGLPPAVARKLLVQAFIGDAFASLEDEAGREELMRAALGVLEGAAL